MIPVNSLAELVGHLRGDLELTPELHRDSFEVEQEVEPLVYLTHGKVQERPTRALEVATAGGHNLVMNAPPGTG